MNKLSAEEIAFQLRGYRTRNGFMACCPAHDDKNPSLSLRETEGKILFHCFAGCSQSSVLDALQSQGLWPVGDQNGK